MAPDKVLSAIPQVYSHPIDSSERSFLTLIPEIRNRIYEFLLRSPENIHIQWIAKGVAELIKSGWHATNCMEHLKQGLAILSTCRQVYHETTGLLYGLNTFIFDSDSSLMNSSFAIICGALWLESLGSRLRLVRCVVLKLGDYLTRFQPVVDLLPMLRIVWRKDGGQLKIKFDMTEKAREKSLNFPIYPVELAVHEATLDRLLHLLGTKDSLDLRRSSMMMRHVLITRGGAAGEVVYRSTKPEGDTKSLFAISDDRNVLEMLEQQRTTHLLQLPRSVLAKVFHHVFSAADLAHDLIEGKRTTRGVSILEVSREIRENWSSTYLRTARISLLLCAGSASTQFLGFDTLDSSPLMKNLVDYSRNPFIAAVNWRDSTYVIQLRTDIDCSLSELTISTLGLIRQLSSLRLRTPLIIRLFCSMDGGASREEHRTTLRAIMKRCFLFLSDIHFHSPPQATPFATTGLFINGKGIPVHAIVRKLPNLPEVVVPNLRTELDPATVRNMIQGRIGRLEKASIRSHFRQVWSDGPQDRAFGQLLGHLYRICLVDGNVAW
jgi:hypothetical protein